MSLDLDIYCIGLCISLTYINFLNLPFSLYCFFNIILLNRGHLPKKEYNYIHEFLSTRLIVSNCINIVVRKSIVTDILQWNETGCYSYVTVSK